MAPDDLLWAGTQLVCDCSTPRETGRIEHTEEQVGRAIGSLGFEGLRAGVASQLMPQAMMISASKACLRLQGERPRRGGIGSKQRDHCTHRLLILFLIWPGAGIGVFGKGQEPRAASMRRAGGAGTPSLLSGRQGYRVMGLCCPGSSPGRGPGNLKPSPGAADYDQQINLSEGKVCPRSRGKSGGTLLVVLAVGAVASGRGGS